VQVQEAKDFFVRQAIEQAQLDGAPLSDREIKDLYFTEPEGETSADADDDFDPDELANDYEPRMRQVLERAYQRLKKENPEALHQWASALETLRGGDHYISFVLEEPIEEARPPFDRLKLFLAGVCVAAVLVAVTFAFDHFGNPRSKTYAPLPAWFQGLIIAAMLGGYLLFLLLPWFKSRRRQHHKTF
jgi:hypothetical protein